MSSIWFRSVFRNPQIKPRKLEEGYLLSTSRVSLAGVKNQRNAAVWITKDGNWVPSSPSLQPVRFLIMMRSVRGKTRRLRHRIPPTIRNYTLNIIELRENMLPLPELGLKLCWFPAYIWPGSLIKPTSGQILLRGGGSGLVRFYTTFIAALSRLFSLNTQIHTQFAPGHPATGVSNSDQVLKMNNKYNMDWKRTKERENVPGQLSTCKSRKMRIQNNNK